MFRRRTDTVTAKPRARRRWRGYLLEALMVLLGVLAAFLVENYREEREREQLADAAMKRVNREIAANFVELIDFFTVTRERRERLLALEGEWSEDAAFVTVLPRFNGYRFLSIDDSAWRSMLLADFFEKVPAEYQRDAFVLYDSLDVIRRLDGKIQDLVFGFAFHEPEQTREVWAVSAQIMEQQIIWARDVIDDFCGFMGRWAPGLYTAHRDLNWPHEIEGTSVEAACDELASITRARR